MSVVSRIRSLWREVGRGKQVEAELTEEVSAYVELLMQEKVKAGMSPQEAGGAGGEGWRESGISISAEYEGGPRTL